MKKIILKNVILMGMLIVSLCGCGDVEEEHEKTQVEESGSLESKTETIENEDSKASEEKNIEESNEENSSDEQELVELHPIVEIKTLTEEEQVVWENYYRDKMVEYTDETVVEVVVKDFAANGNVQAFITTSPETDSAIASADSEDGYVTSSLWYLADDEIINLYKDQDGYFLHIYGITLGNNRSILIVPHVTGNARQCMSYVYTIRNDEPICEDWGEMNVYLEDGYIASSHTYIDYIYQGTLIWSYYYLYDFDGNEFTQVGGGAEDWKGDSISLEEFDLAFNVEREDFVKEYIIDDGVNWAPKTLDGRRIKAEHRNQDYKEEGLSLCEAEYDIDGRMIMCREDGEFDYRTEFEYDDSGKLIRTKSYNFMGDISGEISEYVYNDDGRLSCIKTEYPSSWGIEPETWNVNRDIIKVYYSNGLLGKEEYNDDHYWERRRIIYHYDEQGRVILTDDLGYHDPYFDTYEYDEWNRLIKKTRYIYVDVEDYVETYEYDDNNHLIKKNVNSSQKDDWEVYLYDEAGRTIKHTKEDWWGYREYVYEYDENGNLKKEIDYDKEGNITATIDVEYEYYD